MPTYYEVLGCEKNASYEELKQSYHELVKKCHPDKSREKGSQVEFEDVDKAWKTLRDAERRREYDLRIGKVDLAETPLYCEVGLSEMSRELEMGRYSYVCRCGGLYSFTENDANGSEKLKIPCDECTFHIIVILSK